jgi:histidinol-phosphate aminotransferase
MTGTRPLPRDDLRALEGYHSPQVDVDTRLNTNESPYAPTAQFVERWLDALRTVEWNRYPDRTASELRSTLGAFLGQPPARLLCGNGSNEILQTLLLTYGGAGRRALMFEPTYALHAQIARGTGTGVVAGERRADHVRHRDRAHAHSGAAEQLAAAEQLRNPALPVHSFSVNPRT